jgi:hypothetical protein
VSGDFKVPVRIDAVALKAFKTCNREVQAG